MTSTYSEWWKVEIWRLAFGHLDSSDTETPDIDLGIVVLTANKFLHMREKRRGQITTRFKRILIKGKTYLMVMVISCVLCGCGVVRLVWFVHIREPSSTESTRFVGRNELVNKYTRHETRDTIRRTPTTELRLVLSSVSCAQ